MALDVNQRSLTPTHPQLSPAPAFVSMFALECATCTSSITVFVTVSHDVALDAHRAHVYNSIL